LLVDLAAIVYVPSSFFVDVYSSAGTFTLPFITVATPSFTDTSQFAIVCLSIPHLAICFAVSVLSEDTEPASVYPLIPVTLTLYFAPLVTSVAVS